MAWFKRKEKGITTATEDKMDVPKGLWYKSPTGKIIDTDELARNLWVSPEGADAPNKKHYDPRKWIREGELTFNTRLEQAFADLNNVNTL